MHEQYRVTSDMRRNSACIQMISDIDERGVHLFYRLCKHRRKPLGVWQCSVLENILSQHIDRIYSIALFGVQV